MRSFIFTVVDNNLQKINQSISNPFTALDFSLSLPVSWYLSRLFLLKALKTSSCCTTRFFCCNHFFNVVVVVVVIFFQSPTYTCVPGRLLVCVGFSSPERASQDGKPVADLLVLLPGWLLYH